MTNKMKQELFKKMLEKEHLAERFCNGETFDGRNYSAESTGAFEMLQILGLAKEYTDWSCGK